jgi:hypothetical protein
LNTRTIPNRSARNALIGTFFGDCPTTLGCELPTAAKLVDDRRFFLSIRRIPRVNYRLHFGSSLLTGPFCRSVATDSKFPGPGQVTGCERLIKMINDAAA